MRRREFIMLMTAWPLAARAQQSKRPTIGFIGGSSSAGGMALVECFISGLRDLGWIDGKSIKIEVRWTEGLADRYTAIANEFANSQFDLIVVTSTPGTRRSNKRLKIFPSFFWGSAIPWKAAL